MDLHIRRIFYLLLVSSLLHLQARADSTDSVLFLDSPTHQYFCPQSSKYVESHSMLLPEVGAATSVLLGFAPPATLSASGSSKLNDVLKPNPFDRPRAVFMLEVAGIDDPQLAFDPANALFSNVFMSKITQGSDKANIQLPDVDEVSVVSLDGGLVDYYDQDISILASWLDGSYVAEEMNPLNGELTIPLATGGNMRLHMSKKADRQFVASLLVLFYRCQTAIGKHDSLSEGTKKPAELMTGSFHGIKALQEQYEDKGVVQQGIGVLLAALSKIQASYKGKIVGVVFFNGTPSPQPETMLNVMFTSPKSARWLAETKGSSTATLAELALVRRTLAWLTGIILLIATLLGTYFLLNMPLTRDTLLYSNVKLD